MRFAVYNILTSPPHLTGEVTLAPDTDVHGSVQQWWRTDGHFGKQLVVLGG
jgi:hypothetical protein